MRLLALLVLGCTSSNPSKPAPCFEGSTRICCGSDGEVRGVNCSPPREPGCSPEGAAAPGKTLRPVCCDGLTAVGICGLPPDSQLCIRCAGPCPACVTPDAG